MNYGTPKMVIFAIIAILFLAIGLILVEDYHVRSNMPYNELGRYWDGQVVWLEQNVPVIGALAGFLLLLSGLFAYFSWRNKNREIAP